MQQASSVLLLGNNHSLAEAFLSQLDKLSVPIYQLQWLQDKLAVDEGYDDEELQDDVDSNRLLWKNSSLERVSQDEINWDLQSIVVLLENNDELRDLAEQAAQHDCWVIDMRQLSAAVNVIDARVNADAISEASFKKWLSCSGSIAGQLALLLNTLTQDVAIEQVQVSALLSANHFGADGVKALAGQTARLLNGLPLEEDIFKGQLAFNLLPLPALAEGDVSFEQSVSEQVMHLTQQRSLDLNITALIAPVFYADSLLVSLRSNYPWYPEEVVAMLGQNSYFSVLEDKIANPVIDGKDAETLLISDVRRAGNNESAINLRLIANNPQLGTALNAALLVESLINQYI